jgi:hypothetical protein
MRFANATNINRKSGGAKQTCPALPRLAVGRAVEGSAVPRTYFQGSAARDFRANFHGALFVPGVQKGDGLRLRQSLQGSGHRR